MNQRTLLMALVTVAVVGCSQDQPKPSTPADSTPPSASLDEIDDTVGQSRLPAPAEQAQPPTPITYPGIRAAQEGVIALPGDVPLTLLWCPPGEFTMGSPKSEAGRRDDEGQVAVTLTHGFWLGKTEVTQAQWGAVMGTRPWQRAFFGQEGKNFPATNISWDDAMAFCQKVTAHLAGQLPVDWKCTLPTEAQWEYACRAGTTSRFHFGNEESEMWRYAWYKLSPFGFSDLHAWELDGTLGQRMIAPYRHPSEVGKKQPNAFGLYDMHGNVDEWCRDWYGAALPGGTNPEGLEDGNRRVNRSGTWGSPADYCRSASRNSSGPTYGFDFRGFRIAAVPSNKHEAGGR